MTDNRSSLGAGVTALVLTALLIAFAAKGPPRPVPATAPDSVFSADRAMRHVRAIAERPHPPGSADHARVRDYVLAELGALGVTPEVQRTTAVGTRFQQAGRVENVMARLPGTKPGGPAIMLAAHYDGVGAAPAASDDASGSAVLLEVLRALRAGAPLEHDVILLFTDLEEAGLLGAAAFVAEHPWARDVEVMINFEARGTGGQAVMFQTGPGNLDQIRLLRRQPHVVASSIAVTVYQFLPNDTDLSEFFALGKPGLNFAFADGVERYHTSEDDAEHIDPGSIQQEGGAALGLTRAFGHGPLPRPVTGNAIFFNLPFFGLVVYPETWARPIAALAILLTLLAIVQVSRRERRWILGLGLGLIAMVVTGAIGGAAAFGLGLRAPAAVAAPGARGAYALGLALIGLGAVLLVWAVIRRWVSAATTGLGPLLVWTGLAAVASWKLPGVSFVVAWPAIAAAVLALVPASDTPNWFARLRQWLPLVVAGVLIVPLLYDMGIVALGLIGPGGIAIGLFTPVVAWLLVPTIDRITVDRPWSVTLAVMAAAVVATGAGIAIGRRSTDFPVRSILTYAENADATDGWLLTAAALAGPGTWAEAAVGPNARKVPVDGPELPNEPPRWLTQVAGGRFSVLAAAAPRAGLGAPVVTVLGDSAETAGRRLTLRIEPGGQTTVVGISVTESPVLSATIDGRVVDPSRYRFKSPDWQVAYWAPADSGFTLSLVIPKDARPVVGLTRQIAGLPALAGVTIPPRPAGVLPSQTGDISVVYRKLTF